MDHVARSVATLIGCGDISERLNYEEKSRYPEWLNPPRRWDGMQTATIKSIAIRNEVPICKGEGKYKSTIGFCDVVLKVNRVHSFNGSYEEMGHGGKWVVKPYEDYEMNVDIVIEVKASNVSVFDALRQIRLYREYMFGFWCLATTYQMNSSDLDALQRNGVHHIFLGDKFQKWADEFDATLGNSVEV